MYMSSKSGKIFTFKYTILFYFKTAEYNFQNIYRKWDKSYVNEDCKIEILFAVLRKNINERVCHLGAFTNYVAEFDVNPLNVPEVVLSLGTRRQNTLSEKSH